MMTYRYVGSIRHLGHEATIFHASSGKTARIEVWAIDGKTRRRLDTRRCSPKSARTRADELVRFWAKDTHQPTGDV